MSILRELDLDDGRWTSFVATRPEASAFHEPAWCRLIADCYGYRPFALALLDRDGHLEAGLPLVETRTPLRRRRCWTSLPFTDACPPLVLQHEAESPLLEALERIRADNGIDRLEIRSKVVAPVGVPLSRGVRHLLELEPDERAVFQRLSRTHRQNVGRATRDGVIVRRADCRADLDRIFYAIQTETRRRLGVPIQPRRFYTLLWERMLSADHGFLLLAYSGRTPIAGAVFLGAKATLTFKYSASLKPFWSLRPNALLLWTAIQHACQSGMRVFDFGRTELNDHGLRDFKLNWGAREESLSYTVLGRSSAGNFPAVAQATAGVVIRHSPAIVCRALGASLYKYA